MVDLYDPMPDEHKDFQQELTAYYLDSRYKNDITKLSVFMNRERAEEYLRKTEEMLEWFTQEKKF